MDSAISLILRFKCHIKLVKSGWRSKLKIKYASDEYMEKANKLTQEEIERLQSRMRNKLTRREEEKKLSLIEVLAIQLQLDDEQLAEWRERRIEINKKHKN
jgi:hypothetical protein